MLILKLDQLREGVSDIFDHLSEKKFVIFELDEQINQKPKMMELHKERILLREEARVNYGYLAVIITGEGDKSFRDTYHRDLLCVRPKALSKKEVEELGLPTHKFITEKIGQSVSYKLMTQVKKRECKGFFLSREGEFSNLAQLLFYRIILPGISYCVR